MLEMFSEYQWYLLWERANTYMKTDLWQTPFTQVYLKTIPLWYPLIISPRILSQGSIPVPRLSVTVGPKTIMGIQTPQGTTPIVDWQYGFKQIPLQTQSVKSAWNDREKPVKRQWKTRENQSKTWAWKPHTFIQNFEDWFTDSIRLRGKVTLFWLYISAVNECL